jgi:predicted nucleic acid-binding Zn ribbon protein
MVKHCKHVLNKENKRKKKMEKKWVKGQEN